MSGHHAVHAGLQSHSVGGAYPLCIVGYGNGPQHMWVIENLVDGTVWCYSDMVDELFPLQWNRYEHASNNLDHVLADTPNIAGVWVKGRPKFNAMGYLEM